MKKNVLTQNLSEPLDFITSAIVEIDPGDGNLIVDGSISNESELASGTLQYLEKNGLPTWSVNMSDKPAIFTIKAAIRNQFWMRMPWAGCNSATEWNIHLNRAVPSGIKAHSNGGNIKLDLTGMPVSHVSAVTGGGNVEVTLPDPEAAIRLTAKSGAGNVIVKVPAGIAAKIQATTGLGKLILSPRFSKIENNSYQSADYDRSDKKVEMTISSGAGNVVVEESPV